MDLTHYSPHAKIWALIHEAKIGPRQFIKILAEHQTIDNIFQKILTDAPQVNGGSVSAMSNSPAGLEHAEAFINRLGARDINVASLLDLGYPHGFTELNDPPPLFFYEGTLPLPNEKMVALVGSREVSAEGIAVATRFGKMMAEKNVSVVSALTPGVNIAAFIGALAGEGRSYAVLPAGHDSIVSTESAILKPQIVSRGGIISEYAPEVCEDPARIVAANRLIVGLPQAVVVGEFSPASVAALDVARCCDELGKILFYLVTDDTANESAYGAIAEYGAIPLRFPEDIPDLLKCLV